MTPHNQAEKTAIAPVVLMPGDPLRAKFIAETFLDHPVRFNEVRNMYGYTGTYKGIPVSVMGSGMGMPSIGIYSYELFTQYDVQAIIRIGSAGGYTADLQVFDVVLASDAWSESTYAKVQNEDKSPVQVPGAKLNAIIEETASKLNIPLHPCRIHSSDVFYHADDKRQKEAVAAGCEAVEMESFALFHNAKVTGKQAACLLTISDSFVHPTQATAKERETCFTAMMEIALGAAITYSKELMQND